MIQNAALILSNRELMPGVFMMWLESPEIAKQSQPGQFVMVKCGLDMTLRRPLSIHRVNKEKGVLALLFAVVGKGTEWLAERRKGDKLDIFGPLGNGFQMAPDARNLLLVAGGIGIAPLCYLLETAIESDKKITLLLGAATEKKLYPKVLLPPEINLVTATEDGTRGHKGMVTDLIPNYSSAADQIFVCGPMPMCKSISMRQKDFGLNGKPTYISLEMRMGCGLGICYGCTIRTTNGLRQVCKDGPVFHLDEILWDNYAHC